MNIGMNRGKMIGYYGNGAPRYENDDAIHARRGWSPSYNPNPYGMANFGRKNDETFRENNGAYPNKLFR